MSSFYLPVKINNRRLHICELSQFIPKAQEDLLEFIVDLSATRSDSQMEHMIPLISICQNAPIYGLDSKYSFKSGKNRYCLSEVIVRSQKDNVHVEIHFGEITENWQETKWQDKWYSIGETNASYELIEPAEQPVKDNKALAFTEKKDDPGNLGAANYFVLLVSRNTSIQKVQVQVKFTTRNTAEYQGGMELHCIKGNTKFYSTIFDFGSDASQFYYINKRDSQNKAHIRFINGLKDLTGEDIEDKQIVQAEKDSNEIVNQDFYKTSAMRAQNDLQLNETHCYLSKNHPIKYLTKRGDTFDILQKSFPIPNFKVASTMGGGPLGGITYKWAEQDMQFSDASHLLQLYHLIVVNLLNVCFNYFNKREGLHALEITLLVPNIYPQENVHGLVQEVNKNLARLKQQKKYLKIIAVEIKVVSESDAAFLGYDNDEKYSGVTQQNNCLIIDSGRGTTDISFITRKGHDEVESVFRDGIAGAGQFFTYAMLEELLGQIYRDGEYAIHLADEYSTLDAFKEDCLNRLCTLQRNSDIVKLFEYLEEAKKLYGNAKAWSLYSEGKWKDTSANKNPQKISRKAKNAEVIKEITYYMLFHFKPIDSQVVTEAIEELSDAIIEKIRPVIVYNSQKSFRSKLKDFVYSKLKVKANPKTLAVLLSGRSFMFVPFKAKVEELLKKNYGEHCLVICSSGDALKKFCVMGFSGNEKKFNQNSNLLCKPVQMGTQATALHSEDTFYQGIEVIAKKQDALITIGPDKYQLKSLDGGEHYLFFTGRGFVAFKGEEPVSLEKKSDLAGINHFAIKTIFPVLREIDDPQVIATSNSNQVANQSIRKDEPKERTNTNELPPKKDDPISNKNDDLL